MTPGEVVEYAVQKGLEAIAITDHDTVAGIGEALDKMVSQPYLAVPSESTLEQVSEQLMEEGQIRGIYVLDKQGRLEGYLEK